MKKILIVLLIGMSCFLITGCGKYDGKSFVKELSKKVNNSDSYNLNGVLEIRNNEETYSYDVNVSYKKENNFKVGLKNKINNYEQIILRNSEGIYVLTPSLNKSFKFQSEWPYNSSQTYLLQTLLKDIENDEEYKFKQTDNGYMIETKANYSANKDLSTQKLYFDKNKTLNKVEVFDTSGNLKITMNIEEAKQLAKQGDREGAIAMLRQMLEQNEGERELVLLELGVVYNAMGETTQAINHLNEVMRINPENIKAKAYLDMINGILDYYCKDLLNP